MRRCNWRPASTPRGIALTAARARYTHATCTRSLAATYKAPSISWSATRPTDRSQATARHRGTATALRLAYRNNIPVINIKRPEHAADLAAYLQDNVPERRLQHCRDWLEHHLPPSEQQLAELQDLHVDERLSGLLPSQALAAITKTPLRDIADATTDFPFQYDERGNQTGTGLDLIGWYAQQPGADTTRDAAYDQLADHWSINVSTPDTAELARLKIDQMRESLWGMPGLSSAARIDSGVGVGIG